MIIITNNSRVFNEYQDKNTLEYLKDKRYLDVLIFTRDKIHLGHRLFTHPLSSSLKPNETPFKSIIISKKVSNIDFTSLEIIEQSIEETKKFLQFKRLPTYEEKLLDDFRLIDLSVIKSSLKINGGV